MSADLPVQHDVRSPLPRTSRVADNVTEHHREGTTMRSTEAEVYIDFTERRRPVPSRRAAMDDDVGRDRAVVWVNIQTGPRSRPTASCTSTSSEPTAATTSGIPAPAGRGSSCRSRTTTACWSGSRRNSRLVDLAKATWSEPLATIPDDNPRTIINDARDRARREGDRVRHEGHAVQGADRAPVPLHGR